MIDNSKFEVYDWDYEIVYSNTFNIYDWKLSIWKIWGYNLIFLFQKWSELENPISIKEIDNSTIEIHVINFWSALGSWTISRASIMTIKQDNEIGKEVFFSLYGSRLENDKTDLLQVTITLYVR